MWNNQNRLETFLLTSGLKSLSILFAKDSYDAETVLLAEVLYAIEICFAESLMFKLYANMTTFVAMPSSIMSFSAFVINHT